MVMPGSTFDSELKVTALDPSGVAVAFVAWCDEVHAAPVQTSNPRPMLHILATFERRRMLSPFPHDAGCRTVLRGRWHSRSVQSISSAALLARREVWLGATLQIVPIRTR